MKTKIFSFILVLVISTTAAVSQNTTFSILGGVNFHNMNGKDDEGNKLEYSMTMGFHAGIHSYLPIAPEFYIQPGLLFSTRGAKNRYADPGVKYRLSYLEIPLNIVYKGSLGYGHVIIGCGPYLAFAVGGKAVFKNDVNQDIIYTIVVEPDDPYTSTYFRPFDTGANVFAGYELDNGIFFQLNTQLGLLKINPEDKRISNDKTVIRNTCFGVSTGYRF